MWTRSILLQAIKDGNASIVLETPRDATNARKAMRRLLAKLGQSDEYTTHVHGNVLSIKRVKMILIGAHL